MEDKVKMVIDYDSEGLPKRMVTDSITVILDGYKGNKCNATVLKYNGEIYSIQGIESAVSWEEYKYSGTNLRAASLSGWEKANLVASIAGCATSVLGTVVTGGTFGFFAIVGCTSMVLDIAEVVGLDMPEFLTPLILSYGAAGTVVDCIGAFDIFSPSFAFDATSCVTGIVGAVTSIKTAGDTKQSSGDKGTWSYDLRGGTLYIYGSGTIAYSYPDRDFPWADRKNEITKLEISSGISSISSFAFSGCNGLTSITIPSSVTLIDNQGNRIKIYFF